MTTTRYLIIDKVNEVYLKIEAEADIRRELGEYFTFEVPGFKFMPAYQNRVWDGKIRLFSYATGKIYAGLYPYIKNWCKENNVHIVDGTKIKEKTVDDSKIDDLIKALKLPYEVRDYQREAFKYSVEKDRCLLVSPTASGKSLIIYLMLIYNLLRLKDTKEDKILVIVPTTSLVEQLFKDFKDYGYNSERNVHRIYSGHEKETNKRVIISTWQSIYKLPASWFQGFGMVVGDEAHNFKAKSLTSILEKCTEAKYRIGTTGTLDGTQTHQLVLEGLFGPVYKVTTTKELMDNDDLAQLNIDILILKYKEEFCKQIVKEKYQQELDFIVRYEPRNNFISNLALDQKGNTLILFNYVDKHGKPLHSLLQTKMPDKRKLFYVSGETDVDTRESVREITEKEKDAIIVASIGTFSTGINIRNLHNIIFASPSKSQIRVLQSIGRGLRKSEDGTDTKIYDIADDLHWKNQKNYTLQHAAERIKIYSKERFNYKMYDINI